jgi:serine/threonine protein kinase
VASSRRYDDLSDEQLRDVDVACERFEQSLRNDTPVSIESHLEGVPPLEKLVGRGSFGLVYRARGEQLDRVVAVKVPHDTLVSRREDFAAYLAEARTVASLDHPNIVPVYDFGGNDLVPCYIVSKYVDGSSLSARLKEGRLHYRAAVKLVAKAVVV